MDFSDEQKNFLDFSDQKNSMDNIFGFLWSKVSLKNAKIATYEINMKKILVKEGTTVGLANGILLADGKEIYSAENLKVGLFK